MKRLLFGVQATGNGHITRARALLPWLRRMGFEVDVLLSGREREQLFGLEDFGHYRTRRGFTFALADGRVRPFHTFMQADIRRFWRDVRDLNLDDYDLILTDFEPVTAWAARLRGRHCIGIGHQYAFRYPVPNMPFHTGAKLLMRWFAPAGQSVGLHWDSFGAPILPPIVEAGVQHRASMPGQYLVYLPFDSTDSVLDLLRPFDQVNFVYYAGVDAPRQEGHIQIKPYARTGFKEDLGRACGVICGAGFELPSEALFLGKKLLVKPLAGQLEQLANARALALLGQGQVMQQLDSNQLAHFLAAPDAVPVAYPDVARAIAEWLRDDCRESLADLSARLWAETEPLPSPLVRRHVPELN